MGSSASIKCRCRNFNLAIRSNAVYGWRVVRAAPSSQLVLSHKASRRQEGCALGYVLKRLVTTIPVLIFISMMVFSLIHLIPGDPAEILLGQDATPSAIKALDAQMGLNHSLVIQYFSWMGRLLHGNLGVSLTDHEQVSTLIGQRFPVTLELAIGTMIVAIVIAFPLGVMAVMFRGKFADWVATFASTVGLAVPPFWIGILFLLLFTVKIHLFPSSAYVPIWKNPAQNLMSMALPVLATGIREAAVLLRMVRGSLLDVTREDFVRTAHAKGMRGWVTMFRHALPNAMVPILTTGGLQIAGLLAKR